MIFFRAMVVLQTCPNCGPSILQYYWSLATLWPQNMRNHKYAWNYLLSYPAKHICFLDFWFLFGFCKLEASTWVPPFLPWLVTILEPAQSKGSKKTTTKPRLRQTRGGYDFTGKLLCWHFLFIVFVWAWTFHFKGRGSILQNAFFKRWGVHFEGFSFLKMRPP